MRGCARRPRDELLERHAHLCPADQLSDRAARHRAAAPDPDAAAQRRRYRAAGRGASATSGRGCRSAAWPERPSADVPRQIADPGRGHPAGGAGPVGRSAATLRRSRRGDPAFHQLRRRSVARPHGYLDRALALRRAGRAGRGRRAWPTTRMLRDHAGRPAALHALLQAPLRARRSATTTGWRCC